MSKDKRVIKRALVLATTKPYTRHNLPEHTVAAYNCQCGHKGAVQNGLANPHCSSCGSRVTAKAVATASTKKTKAPSLKDCASTVSLLCGGCDTHNLMATATAVEFDGKTHCVACGQGLEYEVADVLEGDDDEVNLDNDTGADDFKGATTATEDDADSIDDIGNDEDGEEDHINASLDDDDEDIEDLASADDEDEDDASEDEDFLGGDSADEPDSELGETEDDVEDESALGDHAAAETPVLAMLSKKTIAKARLVPDENSIHIFAGNHCIATAHATKDNAKVFGTQRHLDLVQASLQTQGVDSTIANYGFQTNTLKITASKKLKVAVANVQTDAKQRLDEKLKTQAATIQQSLEIASLGFTRDAFSNEYANPLKDAMYSAFKSLGMDNVTASVKVQKIFADAGDEYAEVLLAKAKEIASMSDVARTQLSQTFASMSVPTPDFSVVQAEAEQEAVVASTQADSYFADSDSGRLDNPMRPSTTASVTRQQRGGANAQLTGSALFSRATLNR